MMYLNITYNSIIGEYTILEPKHMMYLNKPKMN